MCRFWKRLNPITLKTPKPLLKVKNLTTGTLYKSSKTYWYKKFN